MRLYTKIVLASMLLASQMGHGDGCCSDEGVLGPVTQTVCPTTGTTLTYNNFGKPFMENYCTRCHSSTLSGEARMGAPAFHDFDTLIGIKAVSNHVDQTAASGPAATNETMPLNGSKPSLAERQMLAEWIACGMPE